MEPFLVALGLAVAVFVAYRVGLAAGRREASDEPAMTENGETDPTRTDYLRRLEALGSLAGGIAHDLNNLLTAIFGYTDLARGNLSAGHESQEPLDLIEEAARRATLVTRSLLTFSRRTEPKRAPLDLAELLTGSVDLLTRALPSRITLDGPDEPEPTWIEGDAVALQAMLLDVAVATRDLLFGPGTLRVRLEAEGDEEGEAVIACRVSGGGDPLVAEEAEAAVATLRETDGPTLRAFRHVLEVARAHGGRVDCEHPGPTELDVSIVLPRIAAPRGLTGRPPEAGSIQDELILLAGADEYVRSLMESSLRATGFRVVVARDAEETMAAFEEHRGELRLVVLDFDVPGRDGLSCLREMRASEPDLPAIVATGDPDADLSEAPPGSRVLRKPFLMSQLTNLAGELVSGGVPERTRSAP